MKDGQEIGAAGNGVMRDHDPSAHAEVNAIRQACKTLQTVNLTGAVMYTSCECCPMSYATACWARISKIYYAAGWQDYADLFDDANIGDDLQLPYSERRLAPQQILQEEAAVVWDKFRHLPDGACY